MNKEHKPGSPVIELSSGAQLDLSDPDPSVINVQVIAHHLSNVCRFAGAPRRTYSVGEHTSLVAAYLKWSGCEPEVILSGLHHDDAEAFIGDVVRPEKELLPDYRILEAMFMEVIADALDFKSKGVDPTSDIVKKADHWALAAEAYYLMPTQGRDWWSWGLFDPESPAAIEIREVARLRMTHMSSGTVKWLWLCEHTSLCSDISTRAKA